MATFNLKVEGPPYGTPGYLLQENGGRILQENGGALIWNGIGRVVNLKAAISTYNLKAASGSFALKASAPAFNLKANAAVYNLKGALVSITQNLTFFRGEDIVLNFAMQPPQDITGWNMTFTVAQTLGGSSTFTATASIIDAGRGLFTVTITNANTSSLTVGRYIWDIRRTDSGHKTTIADGYIDLKQEVTA